MIRLNLNSSALLDQLDPDRFDNDVDYAIAKYAADPLFGGIELSKNIEEALEMYPNEEAVTVYRGLNFDMKSQYDAFMDAVSSGMLVTERFSSWSPDKKTAEAFAVTKPTYMEFMDRSKMQMIQKQREEAERITGYRGVLLRTRIKPGVGIDIRKAPISHEPEIILPAGTYKVKVEDVLSWKDTVGDADPSDIVMSLKASDVLDNHSLWLYIKKHYRPEDLTAEAKSHLFKILVKNKSRLFEYNVKVSGDEFGKIYRTQVAKWIRVYFYGLNRDLLPWFNREDYEKFFSRGKRELKKCIDEVRKAYEPGCEIEWAPSCEEWLDEFGLRDYYIKTLRETVGEEYRKLTSYESTKAINDIKDPEEREKALEKYQEDLMRILKSM